MEYVIFDHSYHDIPLQDMPVGSIAITKEKSNNGFPFWVLDIKKERSCGVIGSFPELKNAELFAKAYCKKTEVT